MTEYHIAVFTCDSAFTSFDAQREKIHSEIEELSKAVDDIKCTEYTDNVIWELVDVCTATFTMLRQMGVIQNEVSMIATEILDSNNRKHRL